MFKVGDIVISKRVDESILPDLEKMHTIKKKFTNKIYKISYIKEKDGHQYISTIYLDDSLPSMAYVWFETELELYDENNPRNKIRSELLKEVT